MLDIHFIRENAEIIKAGAAKKHIAVDIDRLLAVDDERKLLRQELDAKRAEQNRRSNEIRINKGGEREKVIEAMQHLKAGMAESEERLKTRDGGVAEADAHGYPTFRICRYPTARAMPIILK